MKIDLSLEDAKFLEAQLARHAEEVEDELAHTDTHELQHSLAADLDRLNGLIGRLRRTVAEASTYA